jgi:hypothetical protein
VSIKDLPHVTVEQVLALRKTAIELEKQLADLKASLPKVRADAVRGIKKNCAQVNDGYSGFYSLYDIKKHADKLEAGNECN